MDTSLIDGTEEYKKNQEKLLILFWFSIFNVVIININKK